MSPLQLTPEEVSIALGEAIDELIAKDQHLLAANASEPSLTHKLAIYLGAKFPGFHVDCEYNRYGLDVKRVKLPSRKVKNYALDAVTVFPDIIVHKRGCQDENLLVIEVKKATSREKHDHDIEKLNAFKKHLDYHFAAHLVIGAPRGGYRSNNVTCETNELLYHLKIW